MSDKLDIGAKPFVKWAGGKRKVADIIVRHIPDDFNRYYEPFLGGGALFFRLAPEAAVLSDIIPDLISTYRAVKNDLDVLKEQLQYHKEHHDKDYYYIVRDQDGFETDPYIGARFIYLNKTCFNGLFRQNKKGKFNVPIGDYKNPKILDEDTLGACNQVLQGAEIKCQDFTEITPMKKDFVYFDPPYHKTFANYSKDGFGEDDQLRLRDFCLKLHKNGVYFILSNSNTDFIREAYKEFNIMEIKAGRNISCTAEKRGNVKELMVFNY